MTLPISSYEGVLVVNKPPQITSKDVSRIITRMIGKVKMGHVGTLDPMACGVLPVLLGKATRIQDFLLQSEKIYEFELTLGAQTDTMDSEGAIIAQKPFDHVTKEAVEEAVAALITVKEQLPPMYSAVKCDGKPLYWYARNQVELPKEIKDLIRPIEVFKATFLGFESSKIKVQVTCSKGTYVRSLGEWLAERLLTCGHVTMIKRVKTAGFSLEEAYELEDIAKHFRECGDLRALLIPLEKVKLPLKKIPVLDDSLVAKLLMGQKIDFHENFQVTSEETVLLSNSHGVTFGLGRVVNQSDSYKVELKRSLQ